MITARGRHRVGPGTRMPNGPRMVQSGPGGTTRTGGSGSVILLKLTVVGNSLFCNSRLWGESISQLVHERTETVAVVTANMAFRLAT